MKRKGLIVLLIFLLSLNACEVRQQEESLKKREADLNAREQALLLKETNLQLKEQELLKQQSLIDSTIHADTAYIVDPLVAGKWDVKMTCTETDCPAFAVGDVKTEQWEISYEGNKLIAKAMANEQLVRVYTGYLTGNTLELAEDVTQPATPSVTKMVVRLRLLANSRLEGEREIIRENDCKVVYALQAIKLNA